MSKQGSTFSRRKIRVIAERYARSEGKFAGDFFSKEYGITTTTFYNLIKKAVIEHIVSEDVARKIAKKSANNSGAYGGKGARVRTENIHAHYLEMRRDFMFSDEELKKYFTFFSFSDMTLQQFIEYSCIDEELFEKMFETAKKHNVLSTDEIRLLNSRLGYVVDSEQEGDASVEDVQEIPEATVNAWKQTGYVEPECEQLSFLK